MPRGTYKEIDTTRYFCLESLLFCRTLDGVDEVIEGVSQCHIWLTVTSVEVFSKVCVAGDLISGAVES